MNKKGAKNDSLSEKISSLIQTKPQVVESDNEDDFTTADKIAAQANDSDFSADELDVTNIRKLTAKYLDEDDTRYLGKGISRKTLAESDSDESEQDQGEDLGQSESDDEGEEEDETPREDSEDVESYSEEDSIHTSKNQKVDDYIDNKDGTSSDVNKELFSRAAKDVEKGKAIKSQLLVWDFLLDCRMKFQGCLVASNQLPNYKNFHVFKENSQFNELAIQAKKSLKHLLKSLLSLQEAFLTLNEDFINSIRDQKISDVQNDEDDDSEINSDLEDDIDNASKNPNPKNLSLFNSQLKKLGDFSKEISKRHKDFQPYRNSTIQKWDDKTRLGYISSKNFSAFEQSALKQIDQILMDKQRLITRTQTKRSSYVILGSDSDLSTSRKQPRLEGDDTTVNHPQRTKTVTCKEIFDDDDFYHQLLSELIKRKASDVTDPVQLGRKWMQLQKIRSKMKKTVDTRASKARKVRFVVHPKLVNFMMPMSISMGNENARLELINSLFGKKK